MSNVFVIRQLQTILDLNVNICRFSSTTYEISESKLPSFINKCNGEINTKSIHPKPVLNFFSNKNSKK